MSYTERIITSLASSRLGTETEDGINMVRDLEEKKTLAGDNPNILIPFHAVDMVIKTTAMEDRADKNPYGCVPGSNGGNSKFTTASVTIENRGEGIEAEAVHIEDGVMMVPLEINPDEPVTFEVVLYDGTGEITSFGSAIFVSNVTIEGDAEIIASPFGTVNSIRITGDCTIIISDGE